MTLIRSSLAVLVILATVHATPAAAFDLQWFYCYAPDPATGKLFVSDRQPIGPVAERAQYGAEFTRHLRAQGLIAQDVQAWCVMRSTAAEIERGMADLARDCRECNGAMRRQDVKWPRGATPLAGPAPAAATTAGGKPGSATPPPIWLGPTTPPSFAPLPPSLAPLPGAPPLPFEIAAPLPALVTVHLIGHGENAWVQMHTRFFACGDTIWLSYSLQPWPQRGVHSVLFAGTTFGTKGTKVFRDGNARMVPGHKLGCGYQGRAIDSLSNYADQLVSGTFLDGTKVWSQQEMIEHLLGRISVFAVEHSP
jgi:hypothetical protein